MPTAMSLERRCMTWRSGPRGSERPLIDFAKRVPQNVVTLPLIKQLVRAGTSIGANYCEADDAVSPKDFRHKIGISKKESRETKYWFRMIVAAESPA